MVDFIVPPPPNEEEGLEFKVPPPPVIDDFNGGINTVLEQFENTQSQYTPSSEKLSEAELRKDPEWIRAAKSIYEWNEARSGTVGGTQKVKPLNSDKEYADYALRYMGWFNYNIPKMANEATDLKTTANQQQREDFVRLMDMYDNKKISGAGAVRLIKGLALDPSTYVGIGTFGAGLAGREAAKTAAKAGIRSLIKQGAKQGAKVGAIEGAAYSTVDNALRQSTRIMSGQREGFDLGESAKAAGIGSVLGGALGGSIGGAASYFKNKGNVVPNVTDEAEEFVVPPSQEVVETPVVETPVSPEVVTPKVERFKQEQQRNKNKEEALNVWNNLPEREKIRIINRDGSPLKFTDDYINKIEELQLPKAETVAPEVVTPKVETPKRGTKIPEILKKPVKPKIRTARDYFGKVSDDADTELKEIFEDYKGNIQRKFKVTSQEDPNAAIKSIDELDDVQTRMQEDGFYNQSETFAGETPSFRDDILEDLQNDTVHRDDQLLLSEWERKTEEAINLRKTLDDNNINYKGMSDEEVLVAYDDVINNRIPPARDEVPLELYADDIKTASGGNINNVRVDDIVDPTPDGKDFQTDTTVDLNDKLVEVGVKIMDDLQIPRNPAIRISDQLEEVLFQAEGNPVAREKLDSVLKKNDITLPQLSQLFRGSIADSARRMQKLSSVSKSIEKLAEKIGKTAKPETWTAKLYNFIKQADNIRRGLLVSQIATAMRNNTAQLGRVTMKTLIDVYDNTLKQTFNPVRRAFGAEETPVNYARSFELILNLTKNKKQAKDLTDLLTKYYVKDAENLFTRYSSDVADSTKTSNAARVIKVGQSVTDALNIFNRMQEFWYRRAVFANTITDALLKKGIDIKEVGISDDLLKYVNKADIEKAVDDSLYFTYAKTPDNKIIKPLVDFVNNLPFVLTGVIPFPRFIANALAFQFRHSPLGFASLLTPKEIAKLKGGDYKTLSQAVVGTTLLLTAVEMKRKGSEDHKWYEVETSSGKTIDMRPYFPLTPYLLVADMIVRSESGRGAPDAKDVLQGLTGAQFRAGASIQLVQNALDGMAGLDTKEKLNKFFSEYTSNVLGGYLTPIRMFGDFIDAGRFYLDDDFEKQKFRRPLPTGEFITDTTNQLKSNIPFVKENFPESESPTREATPGRPETVQIPFTDIQAPGPLVRQLTGATVREEKNAAEREFDRLGFKRRDILPYSGNAVVDQTRAKYLGPYVEKFIPVIIQSEQYQSASNQVKSAILRKTLTKLRSAANDYIKENRINEEQFAKAAFNRQPKYIKAILNSKGITSETFLQDYDTQIGENR